MKEGVSENIALFIDRPTDEMEINVDYGSEPDTFWKLLKADGSPLDESTMEVESILFRTSNTTQEEHNANRDKHLKKWNCNEPNFKIFILYRHRISFASC